MSFEKKFKRLMDDMGLTQVQVSKLTGICRSSISQYLAGEHEPSEIKKRQIARALGVQENYFDTFDPIPEIQEDSCFNLPVSTAAKLMKKSSEWVRQGLIDQRLPFGYAVKLGKWSFFISSVKFSEYTGIEIPLKDGGDLEEAEVEKVTDE